MGGGGGGGGGATTSPNFMLKSPQGNFYSCQVNIVIDNIATPLSM